MKKLFILALTAATVLNLSGCSLAQVEKAPVTVEELSANSSAQVTDAVTQGPTNAPTAGIDQTADVVSPTPVISPSIEPKQAPEKATGSEDAGYLEKEFTGTIELEGMEETVNYKYYESSLGYRMAYDKDRFTVSSKYDVDSFIAENPDPEIYPYVYIKISKLPISASYLIGTISGEFSTEKPKDSDWTEVYDENNNVIGYSSPKKYEIAQQDTVKLGDYEVEHYKVQEGTDWNSAIRNFYFIKKDQNIYRIETQYFLEAEEGYGARISAMLDTFSLE